MLCPGKSFRSLGHCAVHMPIAIRPPFLSLRRGPVRNSRLDLHDFARSNCFAVASAQAAKCPESESQAVDNPLDNR